MGPRLETVYRQMRAEAVPDTDLTEGLEEAKAPKDVEDLGPAVVSPDAKDSGPGKASKKIKKTTKTTKESAVSEDDDEDDEVDDKDEKEDEVAESGKLSAKQKKLDINDNGKIDGDDLKKLRSGVKEAENPFADDDEDKDDDSDEKDKDDDDSDEEEKDDDSDEEEKDEKKEAVLTKAEMIQNIGEKMGGLRKTKFEAAYETFINTIDELETDVSVEESARRFAESVKVDVSQDVEALLHGEDISEDFRKKATVIFEAAVRDKVEGEIAKFETKFNEAVQDEVEGIHTNLYAQIDEYLTYCAEEWLKSNELAVETGLKEEITTEFMEGLKELFESKYIEIPAERINVVEELADKNEELEEQLKAEMQKNIDLSKKLSESKREEIIAEVTDNLADTQVEKIKSLAEGLSTDSEEGFREAVSTLRENYYPADVTPENTEETSVLVEDIDSVNETEGMSPSIAAIYDSIKRTTAPKK